MSNEKKNNDRPIGQHSDAEPSSGKSWMRRTEHRHKTHQFRGSSRKERRREQALLDWYGPQKGQQEIIEHRSNFTSVGDVLKETFSCYGMEEAVVLDEITEAWPDIVGADVSKFTRPATVRDNVLEVEVTHSAWLYVLEREHKQTLEEKLATHTENQVDTIRLLPAGRSPR